MAGLPPTNSCLSVPVLLLLSVNLLLRASLVTGACQFTDQAGLEVAAGSASIANTILPSDLASCKQACLDDASCVALSMHGLACDLFHSLPTTQAGASGDVYSTKSCTADTTTAPTTATDTTQTSSESPTSSSPTTSATSASSCSSTVHSDTTGGDNYAWTVDLTSAYTCRSLCRLVDTCKVASFTSATCSLYLGTGTGSASGVVTFQKTRCDDGSDCCFVESAGVQGSGTADLTYTATAASCQSVCEGVSGCVAATFKSGQCFLYSQATGTSASTGSTHIVKSCSSGSNVGAMSTCNSAYSATYGTAEVQTYGILILLLHNLLGI